MPNPKRGTHHTRVVLPLTPSPGLVGYGFAARIEADRAKALAMQEHKAQVEHAIVPGSCAPQPPLQAIMHAVVALGPRC